MIDTQSIPTSPGCYLFKDKKGNIIYIGKAKNLIKRVSSYFNKKGLDAKTKALVSHIDSVEFIVTDSETESLILENNLIKKNSPKYNINLKDSKGYSYVNITKETFPRIILARKKDSSGEYYGPFVSAQSRDYLITLLRKAFKIRTCKKMPKQVCLRYHIGLCLAPCISNISKKDYLVNISSAISILKGNSGKLKEKLVGQMNNSSKTLDFEKAMIIRDQIRAVDWLSEKQKVQREKKYDEDIINFIVKDGFVYLTLFNISKGILENKQDYSFHYTEDFLEEFILQYYSDNDIPKEIILPEKIGDTLLNFLTDKKKSKVILTVPIQGEKKDLLNLVKKNIEATFFGDVDALIDLARKLKLMETPGVIECFDISHLSGRFMVGSMVQFRNGKPDKSNYRRFKISHSEIDDPRSIAEVVQRRYTRLLSEHTQLPNLIVIDGGKPQLNAAVKELRKINLSIPVISLAKRFEEVFVPGLSFPIRLDKKTKALKLLQRIRDEAHRFAINYNKLLRSKEIKEKQ